MSKIVVVVPARLNSTRLPGKILKDINGEPMLLKVLNSCKKAKGVDSLIACTDTLDVVRMISDWGFNAFLTPSSCASGSERIFSILDKIIPDKKYDKRTLIINVQGDLPYIDHGIIENMIRLFKKLKNPEVLTPIYNLEKNEITNPNVVKVILNKKDEAILFSRSAIPFIRDIRKEEWHIHNNYWGHVGIYGYRGDILRQWKSFEYSNLEKLEKLEQLRLIEAGIPIKCFKVANPPISVDTYHDLKLARQIGGIDHIDSKSFLNNS